MDKQRESLDVEELVRDNENLREQRRAVAEVLRAVARSGGLQPVLDEIVEAARRLCQGEHAQLYMAEGDLFVIFSQSSVSQSGDLPAAYEYSVEHPHARDRTTVIGRVALIGGAVLGVPIVLDEELIGAIVVGRNVLGAFADEQVELVKTFADQAAIAIANARLIEAIGRQRTELSSFVSPQVAALISSKDGEQLLAGHRAYISCLFCDLRGFTAFAETAAPEDLFEVLRKYHETLGELIPAYHGTLEHFAGDGVMVFFNDPLAVDDHELQAIRLALAAQERFAELARVWQKRGTELALGIGIEAGHATLGRIGFEGRYDYGALGPVTNLASRLSTQAAAGQILIGQRVFGAVEDKVQTALVGMLDLKGFGRPIAAYEVGGLRTDC